MNNLQQEIIIKFRERFIYETRDSASGNMIAHIEPLVEPKEIEAFLKESLEAVRLSTRREIAEELSKLPYHTEKALYGTGLPEKLVTYTSRITDLKNKLKEEKKR